MLLISIGKTERGIEFCEKTGFDPSRLLADPDSNSYAPLGMKKGLKETFFSKETPYAIWEDIKSGRIETLKKVMKVWIKNKLWIPPQQDQAFQQGGIVIFDGEKVVWVWRDPATGAHADLKEVVRIATALKSSSVKSS
jgi:AhpC/TSA antioxidant enzyme